MIQRLLTIFLLVQVVAALAVATLAWLVLHWALAQALLLGLGMVLLLRLFITAQNFVLSWLYRSATPPQHGIGGWQRCRLFADEFMATMLTSSWSMVRPAAHLRQPLACAPGHAAPPARVTALPVLLVHGYVSNRGFWNRLSGMLRQAGIVHAAPDLEPPGASIDAMALQLGSALEALCAATGSAQAVLVAHSMGGLVVRAYLRQQGAARVAKVITLGTPHHGTGLANFAAGENVLQMRRSARAADATGSDWLQQLAASEDAQRRALFTSIYSHHDNIVAPQTSGFLPGANNLAFAGIGHVALARHPAILACVLAQLAVPEAAPAPAAPGHTAPAPH